MLEIKQNKKQWTYGNNSHIGNNLFQHAYYYSLFLLLSVQDLGVSLLFISVAS